MLPSYYCSMLALRVAGALPPLYERSRCSLLCSHSESFVSWILAFDAQGQGTFLSVTATIVVHCFVCLFFNAKQKESGHLSYACPKNMLGEREPPKKKEKKKKRKLPEPEEEMYVCLSHSPRCCAVCLFPAS